jgi:hypothetical protein
MKLTNGFNHDDGPATVDNGMSENLDVPWSRIFRRIDVPCVTGRIPTRTDRQAAGRTGPRGAFFRLRIMRRARRILLCFLLIPLTAGAFDSVDDPRRWAITGLNVVDVASGEVTARQAIVIQNGLIAFVLPTDSLDTKSVDLVVDAEGQYAIPGLWDMHVHLRGGASLIAANERWLPQYLGFGVTAVRDAGGDLPDTVLHWKAEIGQGFLTGPRIFSAVRKIDGIDSQSGSIPVASVADIASALDYLEIAGADFVKIYDMSLPRDLYIATVRAADLRGLKTSAHIPPWVPFEVLVEAGLDSVEHAIYLSGAADPDNRRTAESLQPSDLADYVDYYRAIADTGDRFDAATAQDAFDLMIRQGTAVVATLNLEQQLLSALNDDIANNPRRAETPEPILETHAEMLELLSSAADANAPDQARIVQRTRKLLAAAADAGVMILAGSDTGAGNPSLYPGDSLHAELEALVSAGIDPLEALRAATMNPALWMGEYPYFGSLSPGAAADIVILDSNPLDDIANTRTLTAVVQQGVYFDARELEALRKLARD